MPSPETLLILVAAAGLIIGSIITWLICSAKTRNEQRIALEKSEQITQINQKLASTESREREQREKNIKLEVQIDEQKKANTAKEVENKKLLSQHEARLTNTFKALSADTLKSTQDQFLSLAKNSLQSQQKEASNELEKRQTAINELVKPLSNTLEKVQQQISETEKTRLSDKESLKQQIIHITEANQGLQKETHKLVKALRQPMGRGQWGEIQLQRVVEMAGMQEHCDFQTQTTATSDEGKRLRPDLIVKLPGGQQVVVDSKAPMDAYLDAIETESDEEKVIALTRHANQVRTHIQQLGSKKYQEQFKPTPEFVVLFLPSEAFFSSALSADPTLIEKGVDQNVILATPTTLIALLRAVAFGWRQESLADNAREISKAGNTLYRRLGTFAEHVQKLGKNLNLTVQNYNKTVGSLETSILPGARKFETLGASPESATILENTELENSPRELRSSIPEFTPQVTGEDNSEANIKKAAQDLRSAFSESL